MASTRYTWRRPFRTTYQLIDALGAMPMSGDGGYEGAESGLLQGGTLTGKPIATGNVTFYSKFQVIFANADVFNRLSDEQRTVLRQAAAATQSKAIAEHPKEIDAATAYCADGGTIVLASDAQVAAFEKAAQPVFDSLAQDAPAGGSTSLHAMGRRDYNGLGQEQILPHHTTVPSPPGAGVGKYPFLSPSVVVLRPQLELLG